MTKTVFRSTTFAQEICRAVGPLVSHGDDGASIVMGTATLIAPGWALSARHVFDELYRRYHGVDMATFTGRSLEARFYTQFISFLSREQCVSWAVRQLYWIGTLDAILLRLEPRWNGTPDPSTLFTIGLTLVPPAIDTRVFGFGYKQIKVEPSPEIDLITLDPVTTGGRVVEVHPVKRDNSRLTFPCFRTDARIDAGMSGGPVFAESGTVCGVLCCNLPPENDDDEHVSYVTLLWPCVECSIIVPGVNSVTTVRDLVKRRVLHIEGCERVSRASSGMLEFRWP